MLPVPDQYLDEAKRILDEFIAGGSVSPPVPDESKALAQPAAFCREMAGYVLAAQACPNSAPRGEPEHSIRRAAYYLLAARLYSRRLNIASESLEMVHAGAWEFASV
jgi:hypothetical protein